MTRSAPSLRPSARAAGALLALAAVLAAPADAQRRARIPVVPGFEPGQPGPGPQEDAATALLPAPPEADDVLMLRLRDGGIRWGAIAEHDAAQLRFTLLSTGGTVGVPWTMLDPAQSLELRTRFGYVDVTSEEILVDAERLLLAGGGSVEGVVVSREGDAFVVKTDGNLQVVPKARVTAIEKGLRVPALDIYSADELYNRYAALADPDDPEAQWELARTSERFLAFDKALEHYRRVGELDPGYKPEELAATLARVERKAESQEQIAYLREADRLRKRGQWDRALEALRSFEGVYPDSPLAADARDQEARLLKARDAAAKDYVAKRWKFWMRKLTRELASEDSFDAARTYVDERLSEDVRQKVLEDLQARISKDASVEEVVQLWEARKKARYDSTTYGNGTWLLGEEAALRGQASEEGGRPAAVNDADRQRQELEDRIKRFLKNQRVAARGRQAEEEEDLAQAFWEGFSSSGRSMWLLAYYAENSGDLDVRPRTDLRPCRTCAGRGALEVILTGGGGQDNSQSGTQLQKCPTCQGVGVIRRVHFR